MKPTYLKLATFAAASLMAFSSLAQTLAPNPLQPIVPNLRVTPGLNVGIDIDIDDLVQRLPVYDYKTFHGSDCEAMGGASNDLREYANGLYNSAASSRTVVCPYVRDNRNAVSAVWGTVYVRNVAGRTLTCWMDGRRPHGQLVTWKAKGTNLGGDRTLSIDLHTVQAHNGNYNLYCSLPGGARIASYLIGEYTRTDHNN